MAGDRDINVEAIPICVYLIAWSDNITPSTGPIKVPEVISKTAFLHFLSFCMSDRIVFAAKENIRKIKLAVRILIRLADKIDISPLRPIFENRSPTACPIEPITANSTPKK